MRSNYLLLIGAVVFASCGGNSRNEAQALLNDAREALAESRYDDARMLIDSLRSTYPRETDARREALPLADSIDLFESKSMKTAADSMLAYKELDLTAAKERFTFEKHEKYQSRGYFVLPKHAGTKTSFRFFPEVDEAGKLLLVQIDAQRKYTHTEVPISDEGYRPYTSDMNLTDEQMQDVADCYVLSMLINECRSLKDEQEKAALKIRFFETKIEKDKMK